VSTIAPQTVPLIGFAPDAPATTPGALTAVRNLIPTALGFAAGPSPVTLGPQIPDAFTSLARVVDVNGSSRVFATTSAGAYELYGGAGWRSMGAVDTSLARPVFAQFGNKTVLAIGGQRLHFADTQFLGSGTFYPSAAAPDARVVVATSNFVIAFNIAATTEYPTMGAPDRWWCSAINDAMTWEPSVTTQATTGRLVDGGGVIVAAKRLGDSVVAYKEDAIYIGQYVGPPVVWQWQRVPGAPGAFGAHSVVDIGGRHLYAGPQGIFIFDGSRAEPVGIGAVHEWWLHDIKPATYFMERQRIECMFEPMHRRVWIWYPSRAATDGSIGAGFHPDRALVYSLQTGKFGVYSGSSLAAGQQIIPTENVAYLQQKLSTFDDASMPMDQWATQFDEVWTMMPELCIGTPDRRLARLSGQSDGCGFSTWDMGDDDRATQVRSVRMRYSQIPPSGTVTGYTKAVSPNGEQRRSGAGTLRDGKFDTRQNGRWHHFEFNLTGAAEVSGLRVELASAGRR
jgi:hypothetical protein